jgi:neutral ceramidase
MKNQFLNTLVVLFLFSSVLFSQKKTFYHLNKVEALPPIKGEMVAGVAIRDLTTDPGLPSAGRSLSGKKRMKGVRTRLKARICYLRDEAGTALALIQLDLVFTSLAMHHEIAQRIAKQTDIPISNIVLNCTHTHSGPGNFFSNNNYNSFASASGGFDSLLYQFITDQLVSGILEAYKNAKPAKIATGSIELTGATRNRAIYSYIRNKGNENLDPKKDTTLIYKAINPNMFMLRVDAKEDSGQYKPLFAYSFFSSHGTSVGDEIDVLNADSFAYAQRDLPLLIKENYKTEWTPIHGFTNGTEGDICPNLPFYKKNGKETPMMPVDWVEVKKLGDKATNSLWTLFKSLDNKLQSEGKIKVATREINISENNTIDNITICENAAIGSAVFGGAYENRTPFIRNIYPTESFMTRAWFHGKNSCNGNRHIGMGLLQRIFVPRKGFPKNVMFQLIQINDLLMIPLPWEVTITTGKRIEERILNAFLENNQQAPKHIVISSLSNDYMAYATTPEEYTNQEYEGGHTIYGKNTAPYIAAQLYHLTDDLLKNKNHISQFPNQWNYEFKTKNKFPVESKNHTVKREIIESPKYIASQKEAFHDRFVILEDYWEVQWRDVNPGNFKLYKPVIIIEESVDGTNWTDYCIKNQPIDDEGYDIEIRIEKQEKTHSVYKAKWYNPTLKKGNHYRFKILPRDEGQEILYSDAFRAY